MKSPYDLVIGDLLSKNSPTRILVETGKDLGVASITSTSLHPILMLQAWQHADYQAKNQRQGHQNFDKRRLATLNYFPESYVSEICAESWKHQTVYEAAKDAFKCWKFSSGHWKECNRVHSFYGYSMVLGDNGIWYSVGYFVDLR